jgi:hypothetical protein
MMYGRVAEAIGIRADSLRDFAEGRRELPVDKLQALALELTGGHSIFDVEANAMRSANTKPPTVLAPSRNGPPKRTPVASHPGIGPQPVVPLKPAPKPKRAGWTDYSERERAASHRWAR